jgi:hypothetical protein
MLPFWFREADNVTEVKPCKEQIIRMMKQYIGKVEA